MISLVLDNLNATETFGVKLANVVKPLDVIELTGEPGTGKTTLVGALARAMGISEPVRSPTYTIAHRYRGATSSLSHIDLYRLDGTLDAQSWGDIEPYFESGVTCVEWPGDGVRFWRAAASRVWSINLQYVEGKTESRRVAIQTVPPSGISEYFGVFEP